MKLKSRHIFKHINSHERSHHLNQSTKIFDYIWLWNTNKQPNIIIIEHLLYEETKKKQIRKNIFVYVTFNLYWMYHSRIYIRKTRSSDVYLLLLCINTIPSWLTYLRNQTPSNVIFYLLIVHKPAIFISYSFVNVWFCVWQWVLIESTWAYSFS